MQVYGLRISDLSAATMLLEEAKNTKERHDQFLFPIRAAEKLTNGVGERLLMYQVRWTLLCHEFQSEFPYWKIGLLDTAKRGPCASRFGV